MKTTSSSTHSTSRIGFFASILHSSVNPLNLCLLVLSIIASHSPLSAAIYTLGAADFKAALEGTHATITIQPGDTVQLMDGTYDSFNTTVLIAGTTTSRITVKAQNPGKARFIGDSWFIINASDVTLSGFDFDQCSAATLGVIVKLVSAPGSRVSECTFRACGSSAYNKCVQITTSSDHAQVDHCTFLDLVGQGISVAVNGNSSGTGNTSPIIEANYFSRSTNDGLVNGQEPVQIGQNQQDNGSMICGAVIRRNLFENMVAEDLPDSELVSLKSSGNLLQGNTARRNSSAVGWVVRGGNLNTIEGNFSFGGAGIRVFDHDNHVQNNYLEGSGILLRKEVDSTHAPAIRTFVEQNTVINPTGYGIYQSDDSGASYDNTFINNLVVSQAGTLFSMPTSNGNLFVNNLSWATGTAAYGLPATTVAQGNPNLALTGSLMRITANSTLVIDQGSSTSAATADVFGRAQINSYEIGAEEWSSASAVSRPLFPNDVGATWLQRSTRGLAFAESEGAVACEAENHINAASNGDLMWTQTRSQTGYSGTGALLANGTGSPVWGVGASVAYPIKFSTAGTYQIWIRAYASSTGSDSIRYGWDGTEKSPANGVGIGIGSWTWKNLGNVSVLANETHTLSLGRREANLVVDRIALVNNTSTISDANAPANSKLLQQHIYLEAEDAEISLPFQSASDANVSWGNYVSPSLSSYTEVPPSGRLTFKFSVSESAAYNFYARVLTATSSSDSFYVRVDGGSWLTWSTGINGTWTWKNIPLGTLSLSTGFHTLEFAYREKNAKIDRIFIGEAGMAPVDI